MNSAVESAVPSGESQCAEDQTYAQGYGLAGSARYNMIVTCQGARVWEVDSTGSPTLIADTMTDLEGPAIVPLSFGPYGWPT